MNKKLVLLSGGLDSVVLLHYIKKQNPTADLYSVSFNYGQRLVRELDCAKYQTNIAGSKHKEIDLTFLKLLLPTSALTNNDIAVPKASLDLGNAQSDTYVPNRNMIMLSLCVGYAESLGCSEVYYGAQNADNHSGYFDSSELFLNSLNKVLNLNRKNPVQIVAPFINLDKDEIVKIGNELGVNFTKTHTCYNGEETGCGVCVSCANRIQAFLNNNLKDPISYKINIPWPV